VFARGSVVLCNRQWLGGILGWFGVAECKDIWGGSNGGGRPIISFPERGRDGGTEVAVCLSCVSQFKIPWGHLGGNLTHSHSVFVGVSGRGGERLGYILGLPAVDVLPDTLGRISLWAFRACFRRSRER